MLTILFYHALFLNYQLIFLIPTVTAQIFDPIVELVIPMGTPSKEAKPEIETHLVVVETTHMACDVVATSHFGLI